MNEVNNDITLNISNETTGTHLSASLKDLQEPFYSTKPSGVGMGLGLAIARRLSEALGGRVFLEDGEGGVFVFALPLEGDHGRGADRGR